MVIAILLQEAMKLLVVSISIYLALALVSVHASSFQVSFPLLFERFSP